MATNIINKTTLKAVTVSVVYHRNCFIVVDDPDTDLEQAVREQIMMPNNPNVDISEWSEDEFAVIEHENQPCL